MKIGFAALAALLASSPALGQTVVGITASRDATLYEDSFGAAANGSGEVFFAGRTREGRLRRAVVRFDVAGAIPAGSTIISAELKVRCDQLHRSNSVTIQRVLADWGEGPSNAGLPGGQGFTPQAPDATWIHTFYDTARWTTAGGDFTSTVSASVTIGAPGTFTFASTAQTVADVQGWLNNPSQNFGWIIRTSETQSQSAKRFSSREGTTPPRLTITYTPPPCTVDLNADGSVDFNDYLEFLNLYNTSDPRVDFNADGSVDFNDYLEFLNLYNTGC